MSFLTHIAGLFFSISEDKRDAISLLAKKKEKRIRLILKDRTKKQIVETEKNNKVPVRESRFLSEKNNSFDRQTMASRVGKFANKNSATQKSQQRKRQISKKVQRQNKKISKLSKAKLKRPGNLKLSDLSMPVEELLKEETATETNTSKKGQLSIAQTNDFIEDIPLGDMTRLNTTEYKYYGFYHRIKQKLEQYWGNSLEEKAKRLFRKGRRMPANENKITSLIITLDGKGNIIDILIKGTSGITELDDAAVEAFNRAGPFPNPPRGMIKNGKTTIEWGFVVRG